MKLIGGAHLGVDRDPHCPSRAPGRIDSPAGGAATPVGFRRAFREGVLVEALNPKPAAFFLAFVRQFVDLAVGSVALRFMILGFMSVALDTGADVVVAFAMIALGVGLALARRFTS